MPDRNAQSEDAPQTSPSKPLASWYAQGLSDGLGDRLLMFDNSDAPSLELLRFHPHLAQAPGFEDALREQVQRLAEFDHPAFARVRAVQRLEPDDDLALISNHTPGKRLSEILHRARGPEFAAALIRQLAPALALFQQHAAGAPHGVLDPDRIVVSPDGRLTIVEHVVGRALETLGAPELASLGLPLPPGENGTPPPVDAATDWYQLGLVALSVLVGRPVAPRDQAELEAVLNEVDDSAGPDGGRLSPFIRQWLGRALQLSGEPFESGADARAALDEIIQKERDTRRIEGARAERPARTSPISAAREGRGVQSPATLHLGVPGEDETIFADQARKANGAGRSAAPPPSRTREASVFEVRGPAQKASSTAQAPPSDPLSMFERETLASKASVLEYTSVATAPAPATRPRRKETDRRTFAFPIVAALALIAVVEAGVIVWLGRTTWFAPRPTVVSETTALGEELVLSGAALDPTALRLTVAPDLSWARVSSPGADGVVGATPSDTTTGVLQISAPIELKVFEGTRLLGSVPGGDIRLSAGRHELALVNSTLEYRLVQTVDVRAGQTLSLHLAPPHGFVTIDASPWAQVSIDGRDVGRTPLGPLPLGLGDHEITFRNPAGSSDRQRVTVKPDGVARVIGNLKF
jgi:hypothetical protein